MAALTVPATPVANRRSLSAHGMPKPPSVTSPDRPHRFSGPKSPQPFIISSPISPAPMSPPTSARSFGTFIDSEPSTPAHSPRMDQDWGSSTFVLLRPMSSSSEPSSPTEPIWDMMVPPKMQQLPPQLQQPSVKRARTHSKASEVVVEAKPVEVASSPIPRRVSKSTAHPRPSKEVAFVQQPMTRARTPPQRDIHGVIPAEDKSTEANAAPFGKLASKMRSMLQRKKSTSDGKKKKKTKDYWDVERPDDKHWTEM